MFPKFSVHESPGLWTPCIGNAELWPLTEHPHPDGYVGSLTDLLQLL